MKMKELFWDVAVGALLLMFSARAAGAVALSLQPGTQTIGVGDPASVDLVVAGLGDFSSPSLGGFDADFSYDPAVVSALSVSFGSLLDLGILGSLRFSDLSVPGVIHLDEVSLESGADLNSAQPGSFTLATFAFEGLGPGISDIDFAFAALSDELGGPLADFSLTGASIEVLRPIGVPDSGATASLLLSSVLTLSVWTSSLRSNRSRAADQSSHR